MRANGVNNRAIQLQAASSFAKQNNTIASNPLMAKMNLAA